MDDERRFGFRRLRGGACGPRLGELRLGARRIPTPAFMPVGTRATVKTLDSRDLERIGAQLILANTYHLYLRPGSHRIARLGGLHRFMDWPGGILTDSGGFQVFSLAAFRKIRPEGIEFRSHLDGSRHFLSPARVLEIQRELDSDIRMVLDVCTPYPAERAQAEAEMELTLRWAAQSRDWWRREASAEAARGALFGIVQGGVHSELRTSCARALVGLDFDGYALGGLSVGEPTEAGQAAIEAACASLPPERPRYLMGVGTPQDILAAVARGIDMFDCVLPTRNARKGTVFTWDGKLVVKNSAFAEDRAPLDASCECLACRHYSRAYLRHLFAVGEMLGGRLATIHSLTFYQQLMERIRAAIAADRFEAFAAETRRRLEGARP
ncbi:MAG: tRNA guanosine(34) transglycosylase Tgt [Candidatus Eisenbacteria bacterium]|nr:tRNA guanosine(34) transglycosylase Tgt [Candidatus Eisenbacteria bacterium]